MRIQKSARDAAEPCFGEGSDIASAPRVIPLAVERSPPDVEAEPVDASAASFSRFRSLRVSPRSVKRYT
ncbi:MAG: hypothetical protein M3Q69_19970, partial [Acidobacteriota bacterium]|nr:hypothetical protein [Acidobacteriota bacterium]